MSAQLNFFPIYIYQLIIDYQFNIAGIQFITFCLNHTQHSTARKSCSRGFFSFVTLNFLDRNATPISNRGKKTIQKLNTLFITALFGSIIFVVNAFLPPPINYILIVVQAVLLAVSGLFVKKVGATYAGAVGGLLTALISPALGPFTFLFALLFGILVDGFMFLFRINATYEGVNRNRLIVAIAVSTMLIGTISYSAFAVFPQFVPFAKNLGVGLFIQRSTMLDAMVLFMGPVTGGVAGYAASYLWNKYLRHIHV